MRAVDADGENSADTSLNSEKKIVHGSTSKRKVWNAPCASGFIFSARVHFSLRRE
jgi:hypothetical protein